MTRASGSKAGLLLAGCAYWARPDAVWRDDDAGAAAADGNAVHAMAENLIAGTVRAALWIQNPAPIFDVDAACSRFPGCDKSRVARIWANAVVWLSSHLRIGWRSEQPFAWDWETDTGRELPSKGHRDYTACTATELPCTADCVTWDDATLIVYDWKTGRGDLEAYEGQMVALALAAGRAYDADRVRVVLVRFGEEPGDVDEYGREYDALELDAYAEALRGVLTQADPQPRPGPHCDAMYCPAKLACPSSRALLASHPETAPLAEVLSLAIVTPEDAGRAYLLAQRAEKLIKAVKERVKSVVAERGEAPTTPGKALALVSQSREYFSAERIDPLRREAVVGELRELGALKRSEWTEVREVKR